MAQYRVELPNNGGALVGPAIRTTAGTAHVSATVLVPAVPSFLQFTAFHTKGSNLRVATLASSGALYTMAIVSYLG